MAGDCNAVNALASIIAGYANRGGPPGDWFLMLADIPGVTVQQVTDVTGQADIAFRFPFTNGVTKILLNARTIWAWTYHSGPVDSSLRGVQIARSPPGIETRTSPLGPVRFRP